jgi:hypothetical protein
MTEVENCKKKKVIIIHPSLLSISLYILWRRSVNQNLSVKYPGWLDPEVLLRMIVRRGESRDEFFTYQRLIHFLFPKTITGEGRFLPLLI